ncbi:MAG: hypothetical protein MJY87_00615 [Fibrobacter sp.]|nr:hypothetical protein [Fibrobacter sp.]
MMTPLQNALGCLLALGCAYFFWKPKARLVGNAAILVGSLSLFVAYAFAVGDTEFYPFRLFALALCFSTTSLQKDRRRFLFLAQIFWLWIELFGNISLYYRGYEFAGTRLVAIAGLALCSTFLSRISKEMEFCLMVFWIAVWIFF